MENPELSPPPAAPAAPIDTVSRSTARWNRVVTAVAVAILAVLSWQSYDTSQRLRELHTEVARRLNDANNNSTEAHTLAKQNREAIEAMQGKIGALDATLQQSQGQFAALTDMYAEFSQARDDRAISEVQQAIDIAAQQLQLAGNVQAALAALQSADSRLAGLDQARVLGLRKLVTRDIERLQALPLTDASSVALQLETIIGRIDSLPLGFEHSPQTALPQTSAPAAKPAVASGKTAAKHASTKSTPAPEPAASAPQDGVAETSLKVLQEFWADFRQLIRIERMDRPDQALLSPSQAGFLRENLRLRLLSARLALMQRDGRLFSEDINQSRLWLQRYFDTESRPVASTLDDLAQIEQARLTLTLPSLEDTQTAVRALKLGGKR
jgi:uroporphyrin-3 C-methyltransferase